MAHTPQTRAIALERVRQRRTDWFESNGPCKCGSTENLELDHIDPATKISHRIWSWSDERRETELAKCQVLCRDCHLKKTIQERKDAVSHGHTIMYGKYKCRCELCRRAWNDYKNKRRRDRISKGLPRD